MLNTKYHVITIYYILCIIKSTAKQNSIISNICLFLEINMFFLISKFLLYLFIIIYTL